jgi:integrin alpha FG-GAP repeat containing protein 1
MRSTHRLIAAISCLATLFVSTTASWPWASTQYWPWASTPSVPTQLGPVPENPLLQPKSGLAPKESGRGPPPRPTGDGSAFVDRSPYVGLSGLGGAVIASADFNQDRFVDVVLFDSSSLGSIEVAVWNHELYEFERVGEPLHISSGLGGCPIKSIASVAPGDFDDNGAVDVLVGDGVAGCIFYGNGHGGFNTTVVTVLPELPRISLVMDANADFVPDVFVSFTNGSRGFYTFSRDRGPPTYQSWSSGADESACPVEQSAASLSFPAFVDLDGDCLADLIVPTSCGVEVWSNPAQALRKPFWDMSIDLAHADKGQLYRLFGTEYLNSAHGDAAVTFADFDGDGTIDMAVPNLNRNDFLVFLNIQMSRARGFLCTRDQSWTFARRVGLSGGLHIKPSTVGPLFGRVDVPMSIHVGDYDLDGLPDILVIDSKSGSPVMFRNTGHWSEADMSMQPHFQLIEEQKALTDAAGNGDALAAFFFDTDESGRQDIMVIKGGRNSTALVWNSLVTKSDSLFFKGTSLSALGSRGFPRPFAAVAGDTFKVSYMARTSRHRVTRICSQCSQSGAWTLQPCSCLFGLLEISNYIEEMSVGGGADHRSWSNLMPNSMAVVWADRSSPGSSGWWMEYFTQRRAGQMLRVATVLMAALAVNGAAILVLQHRERKEDRENVSEHVQLFNFGGAL